MYLNRFYVICLKIYQSLKQEFSQKQRDSTIDYVFLAKFVQVLDGFDVTISLENGIELCLQILVRTTQWPVKAEKLFQKFAQMYFNE